MKRKYIGKQLTVTDSVSEALTDTYHCFSKMLAEQVVENSERLNYVNV